MNKIVKDALLLTLITVVAGCALGFVHEITLDPIAKANEAATQKAYTEVFSDAKSFEDVDVDVQAGAAVAEVYSDNEIKNVVAALDDTGETLGYVITITSHAGYGGDITFSIGVTNDGVLNGYSITEIAETAGLGMKAQEAKFKDQFNNYTFESADDYFEVSKVDNTAKCQVDAISGATITSKAMTYGVDAGLMYFRTALEGGSANE